MIIKSLEHLKLLSIKIGKKLSRSDCLLLSGEIGVGKTTFSRYLINFLQNEQGIKLTEVLSPTFNLLYEYELKKFKVMHYDLYRLKDKKEVEQLGIFKESNQTVKIIEWPELLKDNIINKLELNFSYKDKESERNVEIKKYGKWENFSINEL